MVLFRNITFYVKYESLSDENIKEEGTAILLEAALAETYTSV